MHWKNLHKVALISLLLFIFSTTLLCQNSFKIRGLLLYAPEKKDVAAFVDLINNKLSRDRVNTIILIVNYGYDFTTHPELKALDTFLTKEDVKKIVKACRKNNIRLIPQVDLLGHQSSRNRIGKLLKTYPQFDETPNIQLPRTAKEWKWPNKDSLYCKSYCPRHPDLHKILFAVIDELVDVFEADAFSGGMDEVLYIAHKDCPRCSGADPAEVFATEVKTIRDHLKKKNIEFWISGDRLIDGPKTKIRFWEASYNNTSRAIDMIPKDVVIMDWHYQTAYKTPPLFAKKGFNVIAMTWNNVRVALQQVKMMDELIKVAPENESKRYWGVIQSYWGNTHSFIEGLSDRPVRNSSKMYSDKTNQKALECFKELTNHW